MIEIVIAIAIVAFLVTMSIFIIDPARLLAKARNDERSLEINVILNAIGQNIADNTGVFTCGAGSVPTTTTIITSSTYNIYDCLVPEYLSDLPVDPTTGIVGTSTYDTGYSIIQDDTTTRITVSAPDAELGETITVTR